MPILKTAGESLINFNLIVADPEVVHGLSPLILSEALTGRLAPIFQDGCSMKLRISLILTMSLKTRSTGTAK